MNFTVIDVETANPDLSSICQIGIAHFSNGVLTDEWSSLIDPEDYFDDVNVSVHGIESAVVRGQPKLPDVVEQLRKYLHNSIAVSHTSFDRVALSSAFMKYQLLPLELSWLDSARVVRRTWKELARSGYGLANVCKKINYKFTHHDALEDAKAAGFVLLTAIEESGLDLEAWLHRVNQPIDLDGVDRRILRDANPEGVLYGETIVFTGALELPRREAADLAARAGCQVIEGVTKKTTILVVGDQDIARLSGHDKSSKHRRAEQLASEGQSIRIIRETDFRRLVGLDIA